MYLRHDVLSLLKLHLQVAQWHSGFFVRGTGAGWNLVFRSPPVCQLIPVHLSLLFSFECLWSCRGLLDATCFRLTSLCSQQARACQWRGVFTDRRGSGQGGRSTANAGFTSRQGGRSFVVLEVLRLFPALLQSTQVTRAQRGFCTFRL